MLFVTPYVTLTYENSAGRSIAFNFNSPFVITSGGGGESHSNNVYGVPSPGRHGETGTGMRMDKRHIRLVGEVRNNWGLTREAAREILHNSFNPTLQGILTSDNRMTNVTRSITVSLEELPTVEWNPQKGCLVFEIMLVAMDPSPFWRGRPLTVTIAQTLKRWHYPMSIPQRGSSLPDTMVFGIHHATLETRFMNMGNVRSGFTAEFRARHGSVTNPEIRDEETGNKIRILHTMARGDRIVIENYEQRKTVSLNGENALHLLDAPETRFFMIQVGQNRIGYRADENVSNLEVRVRYTPEYTFVGGYDPQAMRMSPYLAENTFTDNLIENEETERLLSRLVPLGR